MRITFGPLPAAELHPSVQGVPAGAGLGAKQVILWEDVMGRSKGHPSRDQAIQVPVNCYAMDVFCRLDVFQDLTGTRLDSSYTKLAYKKTKHFSQF